MYGAADQAGKSIHVHLVNVMSCVDEIFLWEGVSIPKLYVWQIILYYYEQ